MYRFPYMAPYAWQNPWPQEKKCQSCGETIKGSTGREIYGSGRFCSSVCAQTRTPEKYFDWLKEHPEEYAKWVEKNKAANPPMSGSGIYTAL